MMALRRLLAPGASTHYLRSARAQCRIFMPPINWPSCNMQARHDARHDGIYYRHGTARQGLAKRLTF